MTHVIRTGDLSQRLAVGATTARLALLVGGELWSTTEFDAAGLRANAPLTGAGTDQLTLQFGQATKDRQHQASVRGGRVRPHIPKRFEAGAFGGDSSKRIEQRSSVAERYHSFT